MTTTEHRTTAERLEEDSIGSRIQSGVAWKAGSQALLQVSRMVVALILARLLSPHDWGLAAMVMVFSGFVVIFTDSSLGTALIQRKDLLEGDRSTVFWTSAGVGLLLALTGIVLSGPARSLLPGAGRPPPLRGAFGGLLHHVSGGDTDGAPRA